MTHHFDLKVYYEDTDMGGVVYYANYLRFIERARSEIVEELGMDQNQMRADGFTFVVSRVVADYRGSAKLGDVLCVKTDHRPTSAVRWVFDQSVWCGEKLLFQAEVTAVCVNDQGRPVPLPAEFRANTC